MLYLKEESNMGADRAAGLDVVKRLVDDGTCIAIKYAVVRKEVRDDAYLAELLKRVDRSNVISGIGERPAIVHLRDWGLVGFTTGSGCLAPRLSQTVFEACRAGNYTEAEHLRSFFLDVEDIRDELGPARVLHEGTQAAGIAETGPIPPFVSELAPEQLSRLAPAVKKLVATRLESVLAS